MAASVGVKSILLQSANPHRLSLGHCPHKSCSIILVRSTFAKSAGFSISQNPWLLKTFILLTHWFRRRKNSLGSEAYKNVRFWSFALNLTVFPPKYFYQKITRLNKIRFSFFWCPLKIFQLTVWSWRAENSRPIWPKIIFFSLFYQKWYKCTFRMM